MISFPCKQCGKRFDRSDNTAGTMVFCDCGIGNTVPFESTLPPLPVGEPALRLLHSVAERYARTDPQGVAYDPAACFNHPTLPRHQDCAECRLPFCADCMVTLQGTALCGPCKNHRLQRQERPARLSLLAIFSPLVALGGGGFWLIVMAVNLVGAGSKSSLPTLGAIGVLPQVIALTMGALSLHSIERESGVGGREWAMTGLITAVVCGTVMVVLGLSNPGR